jgi:ribosomal protein L35AE/L33A
MGGDAARGSSLRFHLHSAEKEVMPMHRSKLQHTLLLLSAVAILTIDLPPVFAQESAGEAPSQAWLQEDRDNNTTDEGPVPGLGSRILMYPVNRIVDLLDIIHLDFGFGLGLHANVHATRMLQLGAGGSAMSRLGIDGRRAGLFNETRSEISVLPFSVESYSQKGTVGNFGDYDTATQREQLYRDIRDYYEFGASVTAGIVGVQFDIRPSGILDFLAGWATLDPQADDLPIRFTRGKIFNYGEAQRNEIQKLVIVTSRVIESPRVGSEARSGVAVYLNRANGEFFWGDIGRLAGSGEDAQEEATLNEGLATLDYDVEVDLAERFAETYRRNAPRTEIVPASTFSDVASQKVVKRVADEDVLRFPNYKGLCEAHGADAVADLRVLEWSLFQHQPGQGVRIRLNVECKIIKQPENEVLVDISEMIYDIEKETKTEMSEFAANNSRLVRIETQQALDIVIARFTDRLFEK